MPYNSKKNTLLRGGGDRKNEEIITILSVVIGGAMGWFIGGYGGLMTSYFLSCFGSALGLFLGRKFSAALF